MFGQKAFFGHIGDGKLDIFDFLPLIFSLLAAGMERHCALGSSNNIGQFGMTNSATTYISVLVFSQILPTFDLGVFNIPGLNWNNNILILGKEGRNVDGRLLARYYFDEYEEYLGEFMDKLEAAVVMFNTIRKESQTGGKIYERIYQVWLLTHFCSVGSYNQGSV